MANTCDACGGELIIEKTLKDPLGIYETCTNQQCKINCWYDRVDYPEDSDGFVDTCGEKTITRVAILKEVK